MKSRGLYKEIFQRLMRLLFYLFGSLLIISILASFFKPAVFPFFSSVALLFPILWIVNICFFFYFVFTNRRLAIFSVILLLAGIYEASLLFTFSFPDKNKSQTNSIHIISFNTGNPEKDNAFEKGKATFEKLGLQKPDILCLQEFIPKNEQEIDLFKSFENKISVTFDGELDGRSSGLSTYTKYEILMYGFLKQKDENTYALWCHLHTGKDTLTLINVQLQSIRLAKNELEAMSKFSQMISLPKYIFSIYAKLKRGFSWREEQLEKLKAFIDKSKYPVVLCGDFNDPPISFTYRKISKLLNDAFLEKGKYFGSTYAGGLPFLRIDYIMTDKDLKVQAFNIIKQTHSDHYPIVVRISDEQ